MEPSDRELENEFYRSLKLMRLSRKKVQYEDEEPEEEESKVMSDD